MFRVRAACIGCAVLAALPAAGFAAESPAEVMETIQVTATRLPESVDLVPASIRVISAADVKARNADSLPEVLELAAGVDAVAGGDGGPAGSVPEFMGLKEFDAFLLVVDGVPWGGAFNPDLTSLDLHNIERIEVLRGAAPVMYGATSFVGVIHVIHRDAGAADGEVELRLSDPSGQDIAVSTPLTNGNWKSSLSVHGQRTDFADPDTGIGLGHLAYRGATELGGGHFRLDLDGTWLRQDPASPAPREGATLSDAVPLDANHNPLDARLDEDRAHVVLGYAMPLRGATWDTTLAVTDTDRDVIRGFLHEDLDNSGAPNAAGYTQTQEMTDVYFDTHLAWSDADWNIIAGADLLHGSGSQRSANFDYFASLDGTMRPRSTQIDPDEYTRVEDERRFAGLYVQGGWSPTPTVRIEAGLRLNDTHETREGVEADDPDGLDDDPEAIEDHESDNTRVSGSVGATWRVWQDGRDAVRVFTSYRNMFKPPAIDFGPEAESDILEPETGDSVELGLKAELMQGRLDLELSGFVENLSNLVTSTTVNGLPAIINAGKQRFTGVELSSRLAITEDVDWFFNYSQHEAQFRDFVQSFDGVPTQLRGHRLEMSARDMASTGVVFDLPSGWTGSATARYVGSRFFNKRNTAEAPSYVVTSAGVGRKLGGGTIRLDVKNIGDRRDPVAESELGESQFYRVEARRVELSYTRPLNRT